MIPGSPYRWAVMFKLDEDCGASKRACRQRREVFRALSEPNVSKTQVETSYSLCIQTHGAKAGRHSPPEAPV
eukprot:616598-Rhodomonas_salina.1